jgi:hypothetical protein
LWTVWSFPTLEPVILKHGSFVIERTLPQPGEVLVSVGETVTPDQVVARSDEVEQILTLYVASELGVEEKGLSKYVAKSVGSSVKKGDVIARLRRGLRTATVRSPTDGTLVAVDDSNGTVVLTSSMGKRELHSLVSGEVEQVVPERGAVVRTSGTRVYGIAGFGTEAIGPLVIGTDRPDRELTSDNIADDWKGGIVLAGMTAGVPALTRLREIGAAGVIMGSIPEGDIRRFLTEGQMDLAGFWSSITSVLGDLSHAGVDSPFVVVVTEGFGRRPMADRIFDLIKNHQGESISVSARTALGERLTRPEIYLTGDEVLGDGADDDLRDGREVRLVDTGVVSMIGTVSGEAYITADRYGLQRLVADVVLASGDVRTVPVTNIEVIE